MQNIKNLIQDLNIFKQQNPTKTNKTNTIINFVKSNSNCFDRSNPVGHITGSAWLINQNKQILLTHHKKLNKWVQLGGHMDNDANVLNTAWREAIEESGIKHIQPISSAIFHLDIHLVPKNKKECEHYHYDIRYLFQTNESNFKISKESNNLKWFTQDEILKNTEIEASVKEMARLI